MSGNPNHDDKGKFASGHENKLSTEPQAKQGDVIITNDGNKIKLDEIPRWSSYYKKYYAYGYKMIKTKGTYSTSLILHNFASFKKDK